MRFCIHRGCHQIGGNCVEIESQGRRIVLDVGLPLDTDDPDDVPLPAVRGFHEQDESLLGVVISHAHRDHYGLAHRLPKETRFLIGEASQRILEAAALFTPAGLSLTNAVHMRDRQPIVLGPFTITPYLVDHSAYDSYAVLVEADGERILYSGDFRTHGRKGSVVERLLNNPPGNVDVLMMEGTSVGRSGSSQPGQSESALEEALSHLFEQTTGISLVWCSSQNIDRIVTIYRACQRSDRQLIIDLYTAHVLQATGNPRIPQASWKNVQVFLPQSQRAQIIRTGRFDVANTYRQHRVFSEQLASAAHRSVMLFRPSMIRDLERANCLEGARLICSVWKGYLEGTRNLELVEWTHAMGIPLDHCHTSGHACIGDLRRLAQAISPRLLVPIHSSFPHLYTSEFKNSPTLIACDGEWQPIT